jgi:hypothetical protein
MSTAGLGFEVHTDPGENLVHVDLGDNIVRVLSPRQVRKVMDRLDEDDPFRSALADALIDLGRAA